MNQALSGITVVELTHYIAGPLCGQTLADHGATVIKVEPPGGDPSRRAYPVDRTESAYFAAMNRGKRFVELDLKTFAGQAELKGLIEKADVVLTNYAAGVPEKLGFGRYQVRAINPRIVFTHITGFGAGENDPMLPAYDGVIQALSGIADLTGKPDGAPMKAGVFVADHLSAWVATTATLIALRQATITGEGEDLDISMLDAMYSLLHFNTSLIIDFNENPKRSGNRSPNVFASTFPTKDGWIYIAPITDRMWNSLCGLIKHPEYAEPTHPYFTNEGRLEAYDKIERHISEWSSGKTTRDLEKLLQQSRIAHGRVNSVKEIVNSETAVRRDLNEKVVLGNRKFTVPRSPIKSLTKNNVHVIRSEANAKS